PGVMERVRHSDQLYTRTKISDAIIPIAKGRRELIVGDRMTGKTVLAVDAILNQRGKDVICIYCCVGRSEASLSKVVQLLKERGAMEYTIAPRSFRSWTTLDRDRKSTRLNSSHVSISYAVFC